MMIMITIIPSFSELSDINQRDWYSYYNDCVITVLGCYPIVPLCLPVMLTRA